MTSYKFPIAPQGMSGAFCKQCGKHAQIKDEHAITTPNTYYCCGVALASESLFETGQIALRAEAEKFTNVKNIQTEVWLHATNRENWYEELFMTPLTPLIHLGTLESALDRFKQKRISTANFNVEEWDLHIISINATANISPAIIQDDNATAPRFVDDCKEIPDYAYDIIPYVNQWEAIGEVSLFANPEAITIIDTVRFTDLLKTMDI